MLRNIRHLYGDRYALRGVDFDLYPGEVHAVVGDHYSGKTTLARIVSGELHKQHGSIELDGKPVSSMTPRLAQRHRIAIVHQEMTVIPSLSIVENVFAGRFPVFHLSPRARGRMIETARGIFQALGVEVDLERPVSVLSREERQLTEVARVLSAHPRIVILDEIAQRFPPRQVDRIMLALRSYMDSGTAVVYSTSDIQEVLSRADRVTVLRHGVRRATERVADLDLFNLLKLTHDFALDLDAKEGEERLSLAKQYNEDMISNLSVGVVMLDGHGHVHALNPAARDLLDARGVSEHDLTVKRLLSTEDPGRREEILRDIERGVQSSRQAVPMRNRRFLNIKLFPILDHNTHVGTFILLEDVSVDHSTREYLARAERMTSIAELAAGVAHEINNPLGIIGNYVELLKRNERDEAQNRRLAKIESELDRIARIVGSLLSFSRPNSETRRRVDLAELVEEVLVLIGHRLEEKHVELRRELPAERTLVHGDESRLKQVFMNLLTNAVEAVLDHGRIEVAVDVGRDRHAEVRITDDGHGIPEEAAEKVFTPFFSTKTFKKNAGLGLSICQHLVEAQGGTIDFDSVPGEGTTFTVRLPTSKISPTRGKTKA